MSTYLIKYLAIDIKVKIDRQFNFSIITYLLFTFTITKYLLKPVQS